MTNFRQLVSMFNFTISPAGEDAILARFANDSGFDYRAFLDELDPQPASKDVYRYPERLENLQITNKYGKVRKEIEPILRDAEGVIDYLKAEVSLYKKLKIRFYPQFFKLHSFQ